MFLLEPPSVSVKKDGGQWREHARQQEQYSDHLEADVQMLVRDPAEIHDVPAALGLTVLFRLLAARNQPEGEARIEQNDVQPDEAYSGRSSPRRIWLPLRAP
jgi:hypothetical protein